MVRSGQGSVLHHLRGLVAPAEERDLTDSELLCAYCARRDQAAFAVLVHRHGPLVLAICGRVLQQVEDREDAFQATFLALARDAALVRKRQSIASWLHGVARHIALDASRAAIRRNKYEERSMTTPVKNPALEAAWREVQVVLDEEIQRLPEKYREPFVLCCLENQSRAEAAARLGLKEGTVGSRLTEARRRLLGQLARRGVELSLVLGTISLAGPARAHVSAALAATITRTAGQMASGHKLTSALVSAHVVSLVQGVPKAMVLTKATVVTLFLFLAGVVGSGVGAFAYHQIAPSAVESRHGAQGPRGAGEPRARAQASAANHPEPGAPKAKNALWKEAAGFETAGWLPGSVAYSSDGSMLVMGGTDGNVVALDPATRKEKWKAHAESKVGGMFAAVAYSADGKSILATFDDGVRFIDAATGNPGGSLEQKESNATAVGVFPDKEVSVPGNQEFTSHKIIIANARGCFVKTWIDSAKVSTITASIVGKDKEPTDSSAIPLAVDPEGRSVIVKGPVDKKTGKNVLWAWVAGNYEPGSPGNRLLQGHKAVVVSAAWSKDGKTAVTGDASGRVIVWDAKTMKESQRLELGERVAALALSPDGKNIAAAVVGKRAEFYIWETVKSKIGKPIYVDASDFSGPVYACLAFSPDGRQLAGSAMNTVWLSQLGRLVGKLHIWEAEK
jgi:RNA polymerase sigma factor (sigma-70 family)